MIEPIQPDQRKSGIPLVGDIPWGTHFCQFYQTEKDLVDILAPYFRAGLEANELCVWVTSGLPGDNDAINDLKQTLPDFARYAANGQIEIIPRRQWHTRGGTPEKAIVSRLDNAISGNFEGVRLAYSAFPEERSTKATTYQRDAEAVSRYNAVAVFAYPRDAFDAKGLMQVVKQHRLALVRNADRWEVIESSEARTTRNALIRSEEKLRSVFSHMGEGFAYHRIVLDQKGKPCDYVFLEVNDAFERLTGLNREAIIGRRVTEALPGIENDPTDWIGKYGKVALTGQPLNFENYSETLQKWYAVSAFSPHKGFFATIFRDITEGKVFENELLKAKSEWERTFDSVPDLIALLDERHRVVRANRAMSDRLGVAPDQCIGLHCYQAVHGTSEAPAFCPHSLTCRDGQEHVVEVHEPRLGGDFLVSTTPIYNPEGRLIGSVHVARDISNLKKAEEALRTNNERLRILSEASALLLSSDTPESIVQTIANRVMAHLDCDCFFNYVADEKTGKLRLNAYAGIPAEVARGIELLDYGVAICGCVARDGCRIISEDVQRNEDTRAALVRSFGVQAYACHPLKIGNKTIGTLSFGARSRTSFTEAELDLMKTVADQVAVAMERKRAEEVLTRYTTELETANKELESFSYTVSHDLRAPLRSMDGYSQALLEDYAERLDEQGKKWLQNVRGSSQLMAQLIDDILGLSRVVRAEMKLQKVDLSEKARSIAERLRSTDPEREADFQIVPGIEATGDGNLLGIVLENLLGNAFKFTGKCEKARIQFGVSLKDGKRVYAVRDNGAGFDMKYVGKLFQPFYRLHSESDFPGTGIGLATVQRIVKRHGGEVWAEGEPGKGAVIYFTLGEEANSGG